MTKNKIYDIINNVRTNFVKVIKFIGKGIKKYCKTYYTNIYAILGDLFFILTFVSIFTDKAIMGIFYSFFVVILLTLSEIYEIKRSTKTVEDLLIRFLALYLKLNFSSEEVEK